MALEKYMHNRNADTGVHTVHGSQLGGPMRITVSFAARKHSALYLRINRVLVVREWYTGNLTAKIAYVRELLTRCESDAPFLRDLVDGAIVQQERKEREAREQIERAETNAQILRTLNL